MRSYRKRWLLGPALAVSLVGQGGALVVLEATRPEPLPVLTIRFAGEGQGLVLVTRVGDAAPLARCEKRCSVEVAAGTALALDVLPAEGSTFGGFHPYPARPPAALVPYLGDPLAACQPPESVAESGGAAPAPSDGGQDQLPAAVIADPLKCRTAIVADTSVVVELGLVPERLEVALSSEVPALASPPEPKAPAPPAAIDLEKLEEPKPVEVALVPPQKLHELPPPPPEAAPPPPQKPPEPPPPNMTAVEVPDENEVKDAPDDATHISDKNRDVAEETRATDTNLDKASNGKVAASEQSDDRSAEVGGQVEQIRQLEKAEATTDEREQETAHNGASDQARGVKVGEDGEGGQDGTGGRADPGLLAMRDVGGRGSFSERKNGDGKRQGKAGLPGLSTPLSFDDYQRIVGKDKVEEEHQVAARKLSMKKGRWERKLEALRSTLENFTPDIRVGNQTALKTRAQPFAVYLARMHRRIHELWGFGFLEFLDDKPSDHPLNDFDLWTDIEVAINPDGSVYKTTIAKTSGNLEFDVAAVDTIMSAAPYEATPEVIRSVDQRVYLRWGFYRNWRQCGTFNAHPFILTEIPGGIVPIDGDAGKAKPVTGGAPVTPQEGGGAGAAPKSAVKDAKAVFVANMWVSAFSQAGVDKLMKYSAMPFLVGTQPGALNRQELNDLYSALLVESGPLKDWRLLTGDEYARSGGPQVALAQGDVVITVRTAKERFAVVLRRTVSGDYRASVLLR